MINEWTVAILTVSGRGRLAAKKDPRNPWTGENLLQSFVDLNNRYQYIMFCVIYNFLLLSRLLDKFTAEERTNIGIHTCPGGDCDSVHSFDVDYHELLPSMFQ